MMPMPPTSLQLDALLGQEKARGLLNRSFARHRLAHAYLFQGPAGVGKKTAARALAAGINCTAPAGLNACGSCPSCRKFLSGNHPDLVQIKPDGAAIKIGQVRELIRLLSYPPHEAAFRVIILEDVHTMKQEAANSLLKTLEEPPADHLMILLVEEAADLLPTIVSRCQVIPFYALPCESVTEALIASHAIDRDTAATLAAVAEGSLGRARLFLEKDLLARRREIVELLLSLEPGQPEAVGALLRLAEKTAALKDDLPELLGLLKAWFRDLIVLAAGGPESMTSSRDLKSALPAARRRWPLPALFARTTCLAQAERELKRNCGRSLVCEILFLNLL